MGPLLIQSFLNELKNFKYHNLSRCSVLFDEAGSVFYVSVLKLCVMYVVITVVQRCSPLKCLSDVLTKCTSTLHACIQSVHGTLAVYFVVIIHYEQNFTKCGNPQKVNVIMNSFNHQPDRVYLKFALCNVNSFSLSCCLLFRSNNP